MPDKKAGQGLGFVEGIRGLGQAEFSRKEQRGCLTGKCYRVLA